MPITGTPLFPMFGSNSRLMGDPTGGLMGPELMVGQQQIVMQLLTLLMQLMTGSGGLTGGGGMTPNLSSGLAGTPDGATAGDTSGASSSSSSGGGDGFNTQGGVAADPSQFKGGTDMGRRLAAAALKESTDGDSKGGWCARDVGQALRDVGLGVARGDAWTKAEVLAKDSRFREIKVAPNEIDRLPPGAIIVWDKGQGLPYGHISIALGDGREASDLLRKQMHLKTSYRVFMPI